MAKADLTAERLRELFHYDEQEGRFVRLVSAGCTKAGDVAGTVNGKGYRQIRISGSILFEHRMAWLYVYGKWPDHDIDHINGDKQDNRIANLRDVPNAVNAQNVRRVRKEKDGPLGVTWVERVGRWQAQIKNLDGGTLYLGYFDDPEEGHQAYLTAKRQLHRGCTI